MKMKKTISKITHLFPHAEKVLLHIPFGALAGCVGLIYTYDLVFIMVNATYVGIIKEAWDYGRNKVITMENVWDLLATMAGGVIVCLIVNYWS
ncbi:hypothetical protein Cycma_0562 [Cyclobacterium marinum DSM 745]|uniref:Uncharacterized protein n=2 Tax=Cyclobacterium marinum TaxID=104 RepID=G0IY04_CYCMS|nr:hypothetical protein Cycma_0562 [Cyclobacterium marinum DSM 745]